MTCPSCSSRGPFDDGFCNVCGLEQPSSRLPVKSEARPLPALWQQAAPVLARGAALVAAGIAAEWLLRSGARRALSLPSTGPRKGRKSRAVGAREDPAEQIIAISETVVTRRVILRR